MPRFDLVGDEVRNAVREHPGFARAGAGNDQEWSFNMPDRFDLPFIESLKNIHGEQDSSEWENAERLFF